MCFGQLPPCLRTPVCPLSEHTPSYPREYTKVFAFGPLKALALAVNLFRIIHLYLCTRVFVCVAVCEFTSHCHYLSPDHEYPDSRCRLKLPSPKRGSLCTYTNHLLEISMFYLMHTSSPRGMKSLGQVVCQLPQPVHSVLSTILGSMEYTHVRLPTNQEFLFS